MAALQMQRSAFAGSRVSAASRIQARPVRAQVTTQALFGFGKPKKEEPSGGAPAQYHICIDCGYIYDGDFKKAPGNYKCPACSSPKSRFKVYKGVVSGKVNNTGKALEQRFKEKKW